MALRGIERAAFGWSRHREEPQGVERRPSFRTGYGDAAIQKAVGRPTFPWMLRFACNDDRGSTQMQFILKADHWLATAPAPRKRPPIALARVGHC